METRRTFLTGTMLAGVSWLSPRVSMAAQTPPIPQVPRPTHETHDAEEPPGLPNPEKKMLEDNDKSMKKKVERLYQLASELKEQVDKTDSTKVFSLNLMKKAEEIEKLAHDIKTRSKG